MNGKKARSHSSHAAGLSARRMHSASISAEDRKSSRLGSHAWQSLSFVYHAVAFARIHEKEAVLVVTARLTCTLCRGDDAMWTPALWQGTTLGCGAEGAGVRRFRRWRNWLTGAELTMPNDDEAAIDLQALFAGAGRLPFAVLVAEGEP